MPLLTADLLARFRTGGKPEDFHLLMDIARRPERWGPVSRQIDALWDSLPKFFADTLYPEIRSRRAGQFSGAFAEAIAYWFLSKYFSTVVPRPQVNSHTPDFHVSTKNHSFFVEVETLTESEETRNERLAYRRLSSELEGPAGSISIWIVEHPHWNVQ